jgi:hypothetical protein
MANFLVRDLAGEYPTWEISEYSHKAAAEDYVEKLESRYESVKKALPLKVAVTLGEDMEVFVVSGAYEFVTHAREET